MPSQFTGVLGAFLGSMCPISDNLYPHPNNFGTFLTELIDVRFRIHSFLRASTGFELAAFAAWKITVITAKTKAKAAERAKTPKPKGIL